MKPILSLLQSRKFWLTVAGIAQAVAAKLDGAITGPQLESAIMAGIVGLVLAIAHEDNGKARAAATNTEVKP